MCKVCYRCGNRRHIVAKCKVNKEDICHRCGTKKRVGVNKAKRTVGRKAQPEESDEEQYTDVVFQANSTRVPPILVDLTIDGHNISMEIDTGASASLMSENLFKRL